MERERNGNAAFDVAKDGIRKAALFLSVLDAEAADALLARFEPEVARAIEAEAKTIGSVAPEDVDAIVAEFLTLSERNEAEETRGTTRKGTRATSDETAATSATNDAFGNGRGDFDGRDGRDGWGGGRGFQALDAVEPERLARMLSGARGTTVAVALSRLSERRQRAVVALLPEEKREAALAALAALVRTTDAARRLEDALFNGALNDE